MKISCKKYGQALAELVAENSGKQRELILKKFADHLCRNNLASQVPKILADFEKYYNEQNNILTVTVTSAKDLSAEFKKDLIKNLSEITKKEIKLKYLVDESLIGGIILRIKDDLIDVSLVNQLLQLKKKIV